MRYYRIDIDGKTAYTSHPNGPAGRPDPGALQVELDIPVGPSHMVMGAGRVRLWGIGLPAIGQASNLNMKSIAVYGGMGVGLPLATLQTPNAGLLVAGTIYPAFGNWVGTEQTLDLMVSAPMGNQAAPANLVVQHKAGDKLGDVAKNALTTAYPGYTVNVNVLDSLVMNHAGAGFYQSLEQFGDVLNQMSISMFGGGAFMSNVKYPGIQISTIGKTINVTDGQKQNSGPKMIQFCDYVGQPTWLDFNTIQVKTIMRGDINVLDMARLANTQTTTNYESDPQLRDNSIFQGTFMVQKIRHVGNSRQPDGESWCSIFDMVSTASPGSERGAGQTIGAPGTTPSGTVAGPN